MTAALGTTARFIKPQLAKTGELPSPRLAGVWLYEVKWDGYRCLATVLDGQVTLQSRSGKSDYNADFPHIVEALSGMPDCTLDGELVVLDADRNSDFTRMDNKASATYMVFDCLSYNAVNLTGAQLHTRRDVADALVRDLGETDVEMPPASADGAGLLAWATSAGIEGIVAKRVASHYSEGSRNGDWLKIKIRQQQEFAVLGWIPGEGSRKGAAGSLLLAVYEDGRYVYVGRVGTGGTVAQWEALTRMPKLLAPPPHDMGNAPRAELRDVVWVYPYAVQVEFQRWTEDGDLWHPSLMGMRTDKHAWECGRA